MSPPWRIHPPPNRAIHESDSSTTEYDRLLRVGVLPFVVFVEPVNVLAENFRRRRRKFAECLITVGIADRVITHGT